ncbi:MAG: hypothetical protein VXB01_05360 [Opitutae bacterium]|jgi:hypothetical protein
MKVSEIMDFAAELAEFKVIQRLGGDVWQKDENGDERFIEEAQELFNEQYEIVYNILIEYIKA